MHVKTLIVLLTFFISAFAYSSFVQADEDHGNHADVSNAITNFQGNGQQSPDENVHSGHGEGHGDESVIEETPPNYKVLGTFGAINFGFLSLGVILKIRKRKEALYAAK